jgi:hypothetical protein
MKKAKAKKAAPAAAASSKKDDAEKTTVAAAEPSPTTAKEGDDEVAAPGGDAAAPVEAESDKVASPTTSTTPSLAQQSKARSTSFRQGSGSVMVPGPLSPTGTGAAPFSPDGETAPDIYRKHVTRIEELERENKRLAKEVADAEKRWQKAEEELADLREAEGAAKGGSGEGDAEKLVSFPRGLVWVVSCGSLGTC